MDNDPDFVSTGLGFNSTTLTTSDSVSTTVDQAILHDASPFKSISGDSVTEATEPAPPPPPIDVSKVQAALLIAEKLSRELANSSKSGVNKSSGVDQSLSISTDTNSAYTHSNTDPTTTTSAPLSCIDSYAPSSSSTTQFFPTPSKYVSCVDTPREILRRKLATLKNWE